MLTKKDGQNAEQVEYVVMSALVPEDHLLKQIDRVLDFGFVYELVEDKHSPDRSRPGIAPAVLVKMVWHPQHAPNLQGNRSKRLVPLVPGHGLAG